MVPWVLNIDHYLQAPRIYWTPERALERRVYPTRKIHEKSWKYSPKKRPSTPRAAETSCGVEWKTKWTTHTGELIQWTPSVSPNTLELQHFLASSMTNQDDVGTCVEIQFVEATGEIHEDRRTVTCGATLVVRFMRKVVWVQKQNRGSTEFYENGGRIIMFPASTCFFSL